MGERHRIGVVTVTYNSDSVIADFMDSALKQTHADFILYVIDNASSDETLKRLSEYQDPRIVPVSNLANVGVAEGNNIGIRAALKDGCTSVLLINNDTVFDAALFSELLAGLERHQCEMVVPKILYFDDPGKIWSAGGYLSGMRASARHFGFDKRDNGKFDRARRVNYNPTCCMLIKKEVFERIGLMDPNCFVYFDDTDFCLRAHRAGIRLFYVPEGRLLHKVSSLTGGESAFTIRYSTRNHVYYVLKHFPAWQVLLYLVAFEAHVVAKYLFLRGSLRLYWTAQKAFWQGFRLFYVQPNVTDSSIEVA
jgi:GT2 family glycosyltransferase